MPGEAVDGNLERSKPYVDDVPHVVNVLCSKALCDAFCVHFLVFRCYHTLMTGNVL